MANFVQKDNTGLLFLNQQKIADKHPDYRGKAKINGKIVFLSAWVKMSKNGNKYLSLSFSFPQPKVSLNNFESTQETFDEGLGEPQFKKTEADEPLPF